MHRSGWHAVTSCKSKRRYATADEADAGRFAKQQASGKKLRMYLCRYCWGWHLTRQHRG